MSSLRSHHVVVILLGFATATTGAVVARSQDRAETTPSATEPLPAVGCRGHRGCLESPNKVRRLTISKSGVYENYLVDGAWTDRNLVKILADNVTLRHCEIRNGRHNGVAVYARNVIIDSCRIHHLLKGTFRNQQDAHGITGAPNNLTIRNCEIYFVSGDAAQFDPGRGKWNDVTIEHCTFWTAPLAKAAAGFRSGERPGENALDTKQLKSHPRSRVILRHSAFWGWQQGQIENQAALNIKEHVHVTVEDCVLRSNDICFRLRGGTGSRGGARVQIKNCALYRSGIGVRMEDGIENLKISGLAIGEGVKKTFQVAKGVGPGYENKSQRKAPPYEEALQQGVALP